MDFSDFSEDDLAGLTIQDNPDGDLYDAQDPAAAWLAAAEGKDFSFDEEDGSPVSKDYLEGAMTDADLQLGRIGHTEPRIQAGIQAVLSGGSLDGVHPVDLAAAREQFEAVTGVSGKTFASRIKVDEAVQPPKHKQDIKTVLSMLQNTSGEYLKRGPGKTLPGNIFDTEKQAESDTALKEAFESISEIADLYIDGRTRGSSVEPARRRALEESITKRLMEGTFYEGSKDLLPLPNETGVTGIIRTQGIYGTFQGTAEDRLSASKFNQFYKTSLDGVKTVFQRDEFGQKVFKDDVSQQQRNEILRATPSIANSLFPKPRPSRGEKFTAEQRAKQSRDQKFQFAQVQAKADKARKVLREQFPTTRDESKGQIRMSGWDAPVGEQAELQNLRDEAARQGIDWGDIFAGQMLERNDVAQSALTMFIEEATEVEEIVPEISSPKQGTKEWLAQRKGKITASTAAGLLKAGGVEERALDLAMERLGTGEKFAGNADTREGNEGEDKAARAFLAGPGSKLTMQEAYFEENEDMVGFGVSPDGRLYNAEGESAGLLELKYLASGSMKGALEKYTPQMQMQMAVTGESQTHFYALDKFTGEYVHELVKADPKVQAQLLEAGQQALSMAADLDNRGVQALRKKIESGKAKPRQRVVQKEVGQTESFAVVEDVVEPMTAFDPAPLSAGAASETTLAKKLEQLDQTAKLKAATDNAKADEASITEAVVGDIVEASTKVEEDKGASMLQGIFPTGGGLGDERITRENSILVDKLERAEQSRLAKDVLNNTTAAPKTTKPVSAKFATSYGSGSPTAPRTGMFESRFGGSGKKEADEQAAEASKNAAEAIKTLGDSASQAAGIMKEISGLVTGGNESGMSEVRLASELGVDVTQVRSMREALEMGGMDATGIDKTLRQSGNLVKTFNDEAKAAGKFTELASARGRSNLPSVRNIDLPSIQELQGMDAQELTAMVADMMEGKTPEARAQIGQIFGMTDLAVSSATAADLSGRDDSIDESGLRSTTQGIQGVKQWIREATEGFGEAGEIIGAVATVGAPAALLAKSKTMGAVFNRAAPALSSMAAGGGKAASMVKNLSTAAKATPMAMAISAAPMAVRAIGDVKDDGSVGDSALDVLEFATYGAAVGSVVPGLGTAIGGGIGAGIGLANEAWEYFTADDPVPDANIGSMPATQQTSKPMNNVVNVEVTNEISQDMIRTTTDVNGDLNIDEETGLDTGG